MPGEKMKLNRWRLPLVVGAVVVLAAAIAAGIVGLTADNGPDQNTTSLSEQCERLKTAQSVALPAGAGASSWKAEFSAQFAAIGEDQFAIPVRITSPRGTVNAWEVLISDGVAHFQWEDSGGTDVGMATSKAAVVDQKWHKFSTEVSQSGPDIAVALTVDGQRVAATITGKTLDAAGSTVTINPNGAGVDAGTVKDFTWTSGSTCAKL